ncbi:MAG: elongator complex 1 family protein [Chloroflexi bacterium]|nr:elongator complex 1 family protein [Chloroflexota bacterium]
MTNPIARLLGISLILAVLLMPTTGFSQPDDRPLTWLVSTYNRTNARLIQFDTATDEIELVHTFPKYWGVTNAQWSPDLTTLAFVRGENVEDRVVLGTDVCVLHSNFSHEQCWQLPIVNFFENGLKPTPIAWGETSNSLYALTYFPDFKNATALQVANIDINSGQINYSPMFDIGIRYAVEGIDFVAWNSKDGNVALYVYGPIYPIGETTIYIFNFETDEAVHVFKTGHIELLSWSEMGEAVQYVQYSDISDAFQLLEAPPNKPTRTRMLAYVPEFNETLITPIYRPLWHDDSELFLFSRTMYDEENFTHHDVFFLFNNRTGNLDLLYKAPKRADIGQPVWIAAGSSFAVSICTLDGCGLYIWNLKDKSMEIVELPYQDIYIPVGY